MEGAGPVAIVTRVAAAATVGWLVYRKPIGSDVGHPYLSLLVAALLLALLVADVFGKIPEPPGFG